MMRTRSDEKTNEGAFELFRRSTTSGPAAAISGASAGVVLRRTLEQINRQFGDRCGTTRRPGHYFSTLVSLVSPCHFVNFYLTFSFYKLEIGMHQVKWAIQTCAVHLIFREKNQPNSFSRTENYFLHELEKKSLLVFREMNPCITSLGFTII